MRERGDGAGTRVGPARPAAPLTLLINGVVEGHRQPPNDPTAVHTADHSPMITPPSLVPGPVAPAQYPGHRA
ncbi:hypothetical protein GTS_51730 [Gandjariella thermophila]|uniref:Uncharacterized protein n=1 Tax=Gandjariella thermophila TaxID=1931992 RepID=A0A4D4JEU0_9PSEU|nr:hypothetical protein GTS_51730 [Gandjariella thermophila]